MIAREHEYLRRQKIYLVRNPPHYEHIIVHIKDWRKTKRLSKKNPSECLCYLMNQENQPLPDWIINGSWNKLIIHLNITKMKEIKALRDRVLVKPEEVAARKIGAFEIPGSVDESPDRGVIVSIGPGTKEDPTEAKAGDKVIFDRNAAEKITIENEDYLLMNEEDLIAII